MSILLIILVSIANLDLNVAAVYVPKGKIIVNILNPADFTKLVRTQIQDAIEVKLKKSEGRDIVDILMDVESEKLEFKASMWSSYHGVSGELIDNQEHCIKNRQFLIQSIIKPCELVVSNKYLVFDSS